MFPFISSEPMEWDSIAINDEPVSIADFIVEEIGSSDDSITSEESTYSSEERSERSAAENVSIDNPFEDEEIQNFQAVEIRDILAMLDAISNELGDAEDKEFLEMQAMVLGDYTEEELEESDSGYDIDQAADIDVSDVIPEVIIGLGPQKTAQQKIHEWFEKMV